MVRVGGKAHVSIANDLLSDGRIKLLDSLDASTFNILRWVQSTNPASFVRGLNEGLGVEA